MLFPITTPAKKSSLDSGASTPVKTAAIVAQILSVVCVVLLLAGAFITLDTPFQDIPFLDLVTEDGDSSLTVDVSYMEADMQDFLDENQDILNKRDRKLIEDYIDAVKDLRGGISISNANRLFKATEKLADTDIFDDTSLEDFDEDPTVETAMKIVKIISLVVWGVAIVLSLFALLSGFFLVSGFMTAAMIINILPALALVGLPYFLIVTVCMIAFMVCTKIVKSACP